MGRLAQNIRLPTYWRRNDAKITAADVLKVIEPIWVSKTETASRLRGRIENIIDWAIVRGYRFGDNPARWKGHLSHTLPNRSKIRKVRHLAALPYQEIPVFMKELVLEKGSAAQALAFAILTAARTNEVLGATWPEINLTKRTWTVPAERMKNSREHRVPLSPEAKALVEALPVKKFETHLFLGARRGKGLSNMAMLTLLRRMKKTMSQPMASAQRSETGRLSKLPMREKSLNKRWPIRCKTKLKRRILEVIF